MSDRSKRYRAFLLGVGSLMDLGAVGTRPQYPQLHRRGLYDDFAALCHDGREVYEDLCTAAAAELPET
jgi:hypothetical protein